MSGNQVGDWDKGREQEGLAGDKGSQQEKQRSSRFQKAQLTGELTSGTLFGAHTVGPGWGLFGDLFSLGLWEPEVAVR